MIDGEALSGQVSLLAEVLEGYLARIRDHIDQPEVVDEWAERAQEAVEALKMAASGQVLPEE